MAKPIVCHYLTLKLVDTDYIGLAEKAVTKAVDMRTAFIPMITGHHAIPFG